MDMFLGGLDLKYSVRRSVHFAMAPTIGSVNYVLRAESDRQVGLWPLVGSQTAACKSRCIHRQPGSFRVHITSTGGCPQKLPYYYQITSRERSDANPAAIMSAKLS